MPATIVEDAEASLGVFFMPNLLTCIRSNVTIKKHKSG
jgi:hypothetical protein